ncbi:hypothetical protein DKG77_06670 [Flagellimonas aquimarina]|uniref:Prenyltransferase n=1 Tax=Flagellimonas aquimarina TaxID=2201895 RepID=A0A316KZ40_9FLAO|nr:hypothetical protein [Allomuricauda koreensis]PWL37969.1 hypothetical protein DKG77_06670 [Allomuricauda koreensis]
MRTLRTIFNFYLDASIHVALAVVSLVVVTAFLLNISIDFALIGFIFCSTIVCYNFVKYGVEAKKYLIVSNGYHKNIQIFSFFSFAFAVYFLTHLSKDIWVAVMVLGLVSTLYAIPFLPKAKNLRSLGGFKIYIVAVVWVGFTALLPVLQSKTPITWDLWVLFGQRFILVLILILPFEIRDLQWDDINLKTLPQLIGTKKTSALGYLLIGLFLGLTFLKDELTQIELIARFFVAIPLAIVFLSINKMKGRYFASFWVEGIPIIWVGFFLLVNEFY